MIEIRVRGISKALVAQHVLASPAGPPLILAIGDDRSDEDLFAVLPESAITMTVGPGGSRAQHRETDDHDVRELRRAIAQAR